MANRRRVYEVHHPILETGWGCFMTVVAIVVAGLLLGLLLLFKEPLFRALGA
jgi:hypothetical protein